MRYNPTVDYGDTTRRKQIQPRDAPDLVERFFRGLSQDVVLPGSFGSVQALKDAIFRYLGERNLAPKRYVWKATGEEILAKLKRARERLNDIIKKT